MVKKYSWAELVDKKNLGIRVPTAARKCLVQLAVSCSSVDVSTTRMLDENERNLKFKYLF